MYSWWPPYLQHKSSHHWSMVYDTLLLPLYLRCTNTHSCPQFLSSNPDVDPKTTSSNITPLLWHTQTYTSENTTTCLFIKEGIDANRLNQYHVACREPPCPLLFNIVGWTSERMGWRDTYVQHYITTCGCTAAVSLGQGSQIFQLEIHIMSKQWFPGSKIY